MGEQRYPRGFDYGLGEGVIRNNWMTGGSFNKHSHPKRRGYDQLQPSLNMPKPRFKKGDILFENCGCSWKVLRVNKKSYTVQHIADGEKINWEIASCDFHCKKGKKDEVGGWE
jgi:hypothetical protein